MELTVTGIESVTAPAGRFNCYKVAFAAIGQTFWIGVEGARPLVKFQSGTVEAELVRVWGPQDPVLDAIAAVAKAAGSEPPVLRAGPGRTSTTALSYRDSGGYWLSVTSQNIHTPPAGIAQALQRALAAKTGERDQSLLSRYEVRPGSLRTRLIGGQQALSCLLDLTRRNGDSSRLITLYIVWIGTENAMVELSTELNRENVGVFRWRIDPMVDAIRIP